MSLFWKKTLIVLACAITLASVAIPVWYVAKNELHLNDLCTEACKVHDWRNLVGDSVGNPGSDLEKCSCTGRSSDSTIKLTMAELRDPNLFRERLRQETGLDECMNAFEKCKAKQKYEAERK